jgi:pyridoxamine 5'-phosphate oxidase
MTEFPPPSEHPAPPPDVDGLPGAADGVPPLTPEALGPDPLDAFRRWFGEANEASGMRYPNAVTLATADAGGRPDARVVLLKDADPRGFVVFTNYHSAKGRELEASPEAALLFYWDAMGRQIRVRGRTERLPAEESDAYFQSRPRPSRVGAWASEQSAPIQGREALEARYRALEARFEGGEIPRPPHWGGFLLRPREIEFWREGAWRLHDRIRFSRPEGALAEAMDASTWTVERLQP